ncbi:hypothetical protein SAMN05421690_101922 [Nitrosomonas sp. Nm51]|uniref:YceH family protein n=1 Tax=Nitrosomonas sp. Nm51 TaxID=133720 RepID=UPI0008CC742A|nr:YceH family protein [Nitrosomonas sp. Nm51]SER32359.1 hypothetical protein SAMN05421690_101922 [Nitrosomonas sp. Nm51]
MNSSLLPVLSSIEARVLGVLIEKQYTVPDIYPLTLNALISGCSQRSNRSPVMNASPADVLEAVENLKQLSLVSESSGGRAVRYAHHVERELKLPFQSVALIAMLILRGPQTAGELRIHCGRLHKFADISSVEAFLEELAEAGKDRSLVMKLPRKPGSRENRWMHLLSENPDDKEFSDIPSKTDTNSVVSYNEFDALKSEVIRLQAEVAALRKAVDCLLSQQ